MDIAQSLSPAITLHGLDIESRLFPQADQSNIHFTTGSVTSMPKDWSNKFALVNQRLLKPALTSSQWVTAISEIKRVLAPGGTIQMAEAGIYHGGRSTGRLSDLVRAFYLSRELDYECFATIPRLLSDAGFVNIVTEKQQIPLSGHSGADARKDLLALYQYVSGVYGSQRTHFLFQRNGSTHCKGGRFWVCFIE
jgi:hypothetical protein